MEYKDGMISVVEEGEEVNITPKDRNSVEVIPHAVVFHDDGVYRVYVGNKRIVITNVEQQPKIGKWIKMGEGFTPYKCSECGAVEFKQSKYCPNCGVKMEVEDEG